MDNEIKNNSMVYSDSASKDGRPSNADELRLAQMGTSAIDL
jgi:hypothetical protein